MPPTVALAVWFVLLLALLAFDPARDSKSSSALWVPVILIFIVATRLPTQWLGGSSVTDLSANALEEGSPTDRAVFLVLILAALVILTSRSFRWGQFFSDNAALTAFLVYALISVCWSDASFVAFKRWIRDFGNYLAILIALSDSRPVEAVGTVLRRFGYLVIPLTFLLYKYYPQMGMQYNPWTGGAMFVGPATSKNGLGAICLVCGLFFFWDVVMRWPDRKTGRTRRIILVDLTFLAMTFYVLHIANSQTSHICLIIGCLVILAANSKAGRRSPRALTIGLPLGLVFYAFLNFVLGIDIIGAVAKAVGRNPNLTDRAEIWPVLLRAPINPLLGRGYESFWVGPSLSWVWQFKETRGLNEAHNGYLEVYLNLGIIGLFLLIVFLMATYRRICKGLTPFSSFASLGLALWTIVLFYNITEAAFKSHIMWIVFMLVAMYVRPRGKKDVEHSPPAESAIEVPASVIA